MFEKLYSDKVISKLKKIPLVVWYLFFGIASFFSILYSLTYLGAEYIKAYEQMFEGLNTDRLLFVFYPFMFILDIVIFELIAYLVYSVIARRFNPQVNQRDFVFRLRLTMIIANMIIGVISLIYFLFPQAELLTTAIVNTVTQSFFLAYFLYYICKDYIQAGIAHKAYEFIARFYLIIFITFNVINFVMFFTLEDVMLMEYLASAAKIVIYGSMTALAFYHYNKLKNVPPKDNNSDKNKEPEMVFRDFGF